MSDCAPESLQERVDAAGDLFSEHGTAIYMMITLHLSDKSLADDLYQELFLSVIKKPLPRDLETPVTYLWRVIANDVTDAMRKRRSYNELLQKHVNRLLDSDSEDRHVATPLQLLVSKEERSQLISVIHENLYGCEANVLVEKLDHGSSTREIALKLGLKDRSVSHYLSTGLKKLKVALGSQNLEQTAPAFTQGCAG
ncbi:MAG: sigma-70 family RNA polymerase sigma factor [Phycisphaeraceae bacterium]|nr:sigma-70 family RNA polymerase sigma factor [Phycisphaeraceae bacterium]